ncbi:MAG: class I tRNA ligase family protein [Gemmatimonadota bacterium]
MVFPHHEDEIAQSEGATGKPFVRFWLHARHLMMRDEKMSKSLGNVVRLSDLLEMGWAPVEIRYFLLSAQYRNELSFSEDALADARAAVRRIVALRDRLDDTDGHDDAPDAGLPAIAERFLAAFQDALDDDLNTPAALGALFTFVRETHAALDAASAVHDAALETARNALARADEVFGVLQLVDRDTRVDEDLAAWVEERLQARQDARQRKDFAAADAIRDELAEAGIEVEDTPKGPRWKKR